MLVAYENAVQQLLQSVPSGLIPTGTLDSYINTARMQLAVDAECVRAGATLTFAIGTRAYPISALVTAAGTASAFAVRTGQVTGANLPLEFRSWEWYAAYYLASSSALGTPAVIAQEGQGTQGTLWFSPTPMAAVTVFFDAVCLPVVLVNDSTPEVIPGLWTDAVPFYAAWLAMMQLQRQADAQLMLARYKELAMRGRQEATPTVLPDNMPGGLGAHAAALKSTLTAQAQGRA